MNETELKVVLLVTRKTLGWFDPMTEERKIQDYISQSQFVNLTGQSNRAIATAIQSCVEHDWIIARDKTGLICDTPQKRARRKIWYQLGSVSGNKISGEENSQDNLVKKNTKSGEHFDTNLVKKVHSTKETITKETIQEAGTSPAIIAEVIKLFETVNPTCRTYYGNITQRKACQFLIDTYGFEKVKGVIQDILPKTKGKEFFPNITTPVHLREKWTSLENALIAYKNKKQSEQNKLGKVYL